MGMNISAAVGVYFWHSHVGVGGEGAGVVWGGCLLAGDGDPGCGFFNNVKL